MVAVDTYDNPAEPQDREVLPHLGADSARFAGMAKDKLGFGEGLVGPAGLIRAEVSAWLDNFLDRGAERKILYWTGHGVDAEGGFHLACLDSWAHGSFDPSRSFALTELVDRTLGARHQAHTLLVLDACSSHGHLRQALSRAVSKDRASVAEAYETSSHGFAMIGTSGVGEVIREGLWIDWLSNVHNPYFDDAEGTEPHRQWARPAVLADDAPLPWAEDSPFLLQEGGALEREFTGRHAALSRLVRWLDTVAHGMQVVTGPGGSGKTALLGMLGLLSVARRRRRLDPQPPPQICPRSGTIHALITCRDRSLCAVVDALWDALGAFPAMPPKPAAACDADLCATAVGRLVQETGESLNLVFDSLDEAMPGQAHEIARQLLNRLADTWGVKVVVATRPWPRRQLAQSAPAESPGVGTHRRPARHDGRDGTRPAPPALRHGPRRTAGELLHRRDEPHQRGRGRQHLSRLRRAVADGGVHDHLPGRRDGAYWHWHSLHYGSETYSHGIPNHGTEPNRCYDEIARIGKELEQSSKGRSRSPTTSTRTSAASPPHPPSRSAPAG